MGKAISSDRLAPQVLLTGGSGLGKTTLARAATAALLCETPLEKRTDGDSCGTCESCVDIAAGNHIDVVEMDAASNGGIDAIRELIKKASLGAMKGDKKVYIIDEAHGITGAGSQAFLKLLEEPPAHTVWFLATTDPEKMIDTIRGRCVTFELLPPPAADLAENLVKIATEESWELPEWAAQRIVETSDPKLGIRGTVMGLERIAGLLSAGETLDEAMVDMLLGVPGRTAITELLTACESFDALQARDALQTARTQCSDTAIKDGLIAWANSGLSNATAENIALAAYRLEVTLDIKPGAGRLDVAVAKLATPTTNRTEDSVAVLTAAVDQLEARIANATSTASSTKELEEASSVVKVAEVNGVLWVGYTDEQAYETNADQWQTIAAERGLELKTKKVDE